MEMKMFQFAHKRNYNECWTQDIYVALKQSSRLNLMVRLGLFICSQTYFWTESTCQAYLMSNPCGVPE